MLRRLFSGPIAYKDVAVRWIAIPLIVLLSHYLTYNGSDSVNWLIYELLSDGIKVWLVWSTIRIVIFWLDSRLPCAGHFIKRLLVQVSITAAAGMVVLTLAQWADYGLIRSYPLDHYSFDLVISLLFILLVNAVYIILYYQQSLQLSQQHLANIARLQEQRDSKVIIVRLGKRQIVVPFDTIICFYAANKNTLLYTADGQRYPVDQSLDQLEKEACSSHLFRANRQYLLSSQVIQSVRSAANGKLSAYLTPDLLNDSFITISRQKAAAFRQWLTNRQPAVHP